MNQENTIKITRQINYALQHWAMYLHCHRLAVNNATTRGLQQSRAIFVYTNTAKLNFALQLWMHLTHSISKIGRDEHLQKSLAEAEWVEQVQREIDQCVRYRKDTISH